MTCQVKAYCRQRSIPPRRCTLCAASCRLVLHEMGIHLTPVTATACDFGWQDAATCRGYRSQVDTHLARSRGETVVWYLFAMCSGGRQLIATQLSFGITLCGMRIRSPTMVPAVHQ